MEVFNAQMMILLNINHVISNYVQVTIKQEKLLEGIGRVRSIELGNDGYIYAGVEGLGIIKILPN